MPIALGEPALHPMGAKSRGETTLAKYLCESVHEKIATRLDMIIADPAIDGEQNGLGFDGSALSGVQRAGASGYQFLVCGYSPVEKACRISQSCPGSTRMKLIRKTGFTARICCRRIRSGGFGGDGQSVRSGHCIGGRFSGFGNKPGIGGCRWAVSFFRLSLYPGSQGDERQADQDCGRSGHIARGNSLGIADDSMPVLQYADQCLFSCRSTEGRSEACLTTRRDALL